MKKLGLLIALFAFGPIVWGQEICDDGIDNDADGDIDLFDSDCDCDGFGLSMSPTSLIPNPSFEDYSCCPTSVSMMTCADTWINASGASADYLHTCGGFTSLIPFDDPALPPPGGGDGYAGFHNSLGTGYKEYVGAVLTGPMLAGTCYTLNLWVAHSSGITNIDLSLFGTPTATDLPWGGSACPVGAGDWELLANSPTTVAPSPGGAWTEVTLNFTPTVDINAVAIGPDCASTPAGYNYFFVDELILAECTAFSGGEITETGNWCDGDLMLEADLDTTGGTWQWYKDSIALVGETSATLDVMPHGPGDYTVTYTIGSECEGMTYTVTIPDAPIADFTFANECEGISVPFTDASTPPGTGSITSWDWDFGDGGTSADTDPSYTYTTPGTYTVTLTVTSDAGCTHTITQDITIHENPVADFTVSDICFGQDSEFDDITPGTITDWDWDFGDAATSTAEDPTHLYAGPGAYDVTLTVTDDNGCVGTVTETHNVSEQPVADFTFSDICEYEDASFTDASTVVGGSITGWSWDFGDGGTSTEENPTHSYSGPGSYDVELIPSVGSVACSDTITQTINVFPEPTADFTTGNACLGDPATFTDMSSVDAPDVIDSWDWDFGDASSSSASSPTHTYTDPGTYDVDLTVTTDNGCVATVSVPLTIYDIPTADFTSTSVCENVGPTVFTDLSSGSGATITSWDWDFGDGNTSSVPGPSHKYDGGGTYMATLTVTTDQGCTDDVNYSVNVWDKPNANFTSDETVVCNPGCINFVDLSTAPSGSITGWNWDFENGTSSGSPTPNQCYNNPLSTDEYFDVTLISTSDKGCKDTIYVADYIRVVPTPIAQFSYNPQLITITDPEVMFTNSSVMAESYVWDFGDGSPESSVTDPTHTYPEVPEKYLVELEAYSVDMLCKDSTTKLIDVQDVILFYVPNIFTPDGDQYNEIFQPVFYSGHDPFDFHMTIFNRWGEIIFESYDASIGWDGTYGSRGLVEDGTYIWQIEFKETMSDKRHKHRGHVTILK